MAAELVSINGKHLAVNYEQFEREIRSLLPCPSAKIYLMNDFPAIVSADSIVDLLLVIAIEDRPQNYYRIMKGSRWVYLNNLIIPIRFVTGYADQEFTKDQDGILLNDEALDYSNEIDGLRYGLMDYLSAKCGLNRGDLFVHPIVCFRSVETTFIERHAVVCKEFTFSLLLEYLKVIPDTLLRSYKNWSNPANYAVLDKEMEAIIAQAAKDSESGYLTKQKVDRINKSLSRKLSLSEELNKCLISIEGKAGTGKTSQLLILMMKLIDDKKNTLYLTYNTLLVYDIAKLVHSYLHDRVDRSDSSSGSHNVGTLHSFFYRLSRKLGVLHVMSDQRIENLTNLLQSRVKTIFNFIQGQPETLNNPSPQNIPIEAIRERIQNHDGIDAGTKEVGIELIRYISRNRSAGLKLSELALDFIKQKVKLLGRIEASQVFLSDYYKVLENTLLVIVNPHAYFEKFDIQTKYNLLEPEMDLRDRHKILDLNLDVLIEESEFIKTIKRKIGGFKNKRTVFIDEAQDCHVYEKDILFRMFGYRNIVLANGGREQLIRHNELCQWDVYKGRKLSSKPANRRRVNRFRDYAVTETLFSFQDLAHMAVEENIPSDDTYEMVHVKNAAKSFRVKANVLHFCNYIASECGIDLAMTSEDSPDAGEVIFDFRYDLDTDALEPEITEMMRRASLNGCTAYESLIILIDAKSKINRLEGQGVGQRAAVINEYGNIEEEFSTKKQEWPYKSNLEAKGLMFWDGASGDKRKLAVPAPNESRLLYYESCRGLEAWSVACFNIDRFFEDRMNDPEAEKFLLTEERQSGIQQIHVTNDQRKIRFAGTWAIMAMTRPIDTLYLKFQNQHSRFTQLALKFLQTKPKGVKVLVHNAKIPSEI